MHKIYKLSAFPKNNNGGNKAGVVIHSDNLNNVEKQQIATKIGFSETAFVSKSDKADFKVEFYTPNSEVDLCGHATIATFNLLRDIGLIQLGTYTQETKAGILSLEVEEDFVYMDQALPRFFEILSQEDIQSCFYDSFVVDKDVPIQIVSTGIKEIFLPVKDKVELDNLLPNFEQIVKLSKKYDVIGIHAFCLDDKIDAYSRNFAPLVGIPEESATGTSNGALSCYLYQYHLPKESYILGQGYSMNLPSEIIGKVHTKHNQITRIQVGGSAILLEGE